MYLLPLTDLTAENEWITYLTFSPLQVHRQSRGGGGGRDRERQEAGRGVQAAADEDRGPLQGLAGPGGRPAQAQRSPYRGSA